MKAIGKYIVITPNGKKTSTTTGGLILGEKQREDVRYRQATVVKVGDDVNVIKENDNIYYDKSAGFNIEIKSETYKVIKEMDIVIIL
jgi:co-chaperonin GroES (HSP10)